GNPATILELRVGLRKNGPKRARAGDNKLLGLGLVPHRQQHRDRLAVSGNEHRLVAARFQVGVELRRDFRGRGSLHSVTASPPTSRRLRSFTPTTTILTSRFAGSIW